MKEFIIIGVGFVNLVLNLYTLWQVKSNDMRLGFIVNLLTRGNKNEE